jgi:hypothetical protein
MKTEFCRYLIVGIDSLGGKYVMYADYFDEKCWSEKFISVIDLKKDITTFDGVNWREIE